MEGRRRLRFRVLQQARQDWSSGATGLVWQILDRSYSDVTNGRPEGGGAGAAPGKTATIIPFISAVLLDDPPGLEHQQGRSEWESAIARSTSKRGTSKATPSEHVDDGAARPHAPGLARRGAMVV